jgi:hypothetical protein
MGQAVLFLAKTAFVNGEVITVDGGLLNVGRDDEKLSACTVLEINSCIE